MPTANPIYLPKNAKRNRLLERAEFEVAADESEHFKQNIPAASRFYLDPGRPCRISGRYDQDDYQIHHDPLDVFLRPVAWLVMLATTIVIWKAVLGYVWQHTFGR